MKTRAQSRSAFTLLEMMVVISIIALLATLSISAVFRLQESARETNTNTGLRKIQIGLDQQYKAARDTISKETPPDGIKTMTSSRDTNGNLVPDPIRAKALHMKLRMRQEFPQTYLEVGAFVPGEPVYGPKQIYQAAILGSNPADVDLEAAALLVIVLSQNRGGITFNLEEIGRTEVMDIGGKPMRVLMDEYGKPFCLRRWPAIPNPVCYKSSIRFHSSRHRSFRAATKISTIRKVDSTTVYPDLGNKAQITRLGRDCCSHSFCRVPSRFFR